MGSAFLEDVASIERSGLKEYIKDLIDEAIHEFGHDPYSGSWATKNTSDFRIVSQVENYDAAVEYSENNPADKWGSIIVVPFVSRGKKIKNSNAIQRKEDAIKKKESKLDDFIKISFEKLQGTVSKNIGCKHCKSSVNRQFLKLERESARGNSSIGMNGDVYCPVCGKGSLFSTTVHDTLEKRRRDIILDRTKIPKPVYVNDDKAISFYIYAESPD